MVSNKEKTKYGETVLPIIRNVRPMLLPHFGAVGYTEKLSEKRQDWVTELDVAAEHFLKVELKKVHPDISFVGEETGGSRSEKKFWLVDPIDGTTHFVRGLPYCTTMLALIEDGKTVFSAIYNFVSDTMYHAEKGKGAFENGKPIRVSSRPLKNARLVYAMKLDDPRRLEIFIGLRTRASSFHVGASGYELPLVASGKLDGAMHLGPGSEDYDLAPGNFLIQEAGGVVTNIGSPAYDYRRTDFLAANPLVFQELTEGPAPLFPVREK